MWIYRWLEEWLKGFTSQNSQKGLLLLGARQTGKSSLLQRCLPKENVIFINYADPTVLQEHRVNFLPVREAILKKINSSFQPLYIFVDEAARYPDIFDLAQSLMDAQKGRVRFFFTSSSARQLQAKTHNRLPGRVIVKEFAPLSLGEIAHAKGVEFNLNDFLIFGTLPEIVTNLQERAELLRSYGALYVREEVEQENLVRSPESFSRFLKLAAGESGGILNAQKLGLQLKLAPKTIKRFYDLLVATRLAHYLVPYTEGHERQEVLQTPKFYFFDNGVRNALLGRPLMPSLLDLEGGVLFEHLMIQEAFKTIAAFATGEKPSAAYVWREHNGKEVDLIVERGIHELVLFEFKYTRQFEEKFIEGIKKFLEVRKRKKNKMIGCYVVMPIEDDWKFEDINIISVKTYIKLLQQFIKYETLN